MSSNHIYPYVYKCTHRFTGEFYIGMRCANKIRPELDLPVYKTSSKVVNPKFEEFDWVIIAEMFTRDAAYDLEQLLIHESLDDTLLINKSCFYGKHRFISNDFSCETRAKLSAAKKGKPMSEESKEALRLWRINNKERLSENCRNANRGNTHSDETKAKMRAGQLAYQLRRKASFVCDIP